MIFTLPGLLPRIPGAEPFAYATEGHLLGLWSALKRPIIDQHGPVGVAQWIIDHISDPDVQAEIDAFVADARSTGTPILLDIEPMPDEKTWTHADRMTWHRAVHVCLDAIYRRWPAAYVWSYRSPYYRHDRAIRLKIAEDAEAGRPLGDRESKRDYWRSRVDAEAQLKAAHDRVAREFAVSPVGPRTQGIVDRTQLLLHGYQSAIWHPSEWFDDLLAKAVAKQQPFAVLLSAYTDGGDDLADPAWNAYVAERTAARGGDLVVYANARQHDDDAAQPHYDAIREAAG